MPRTPRLTATDWTDAGLAALAVGGVTAVAVEPIAAGLGATKGSFYWHFPNRDALLGAVLARWEQIDTADVITENMQRDPGVPRLRALLAAALGPDGSVTARLQAAVQAHAEHPLVAPVLARVTARRLAHLAAVFLDLGFDAERADRRARLAYTAYLGYGQLARTTTGDAGRPAEAGDVDLLVRLLSTPG